MKTNLLVDTSIFLAILVAMEPNFGGVTIHEWLSAALAVVIVVHLLLHWKWIMEVGGRFFQRLWQSSRLKFVIDALLFVDGVAVMLSGIMISRVVLPALGLHLGQTNTVWRALHSQSADLLILLVGLHFALNWDWVVHAVKRLLIDPLVRLFRPKRVQQSVLVKNDESMGQQADGKACSC